MPYPTDAPRNKHDLLGPSDVLKLVDDSNGDGGSSATSFLLPSGDEMFELLNDYLQNPHRPLSGHIRPLSAVYSYPDAPNPPLSRTLLVVGLVDAHHEWVQSLLRGGEDIGRNSDDASMMRRCNIGVKRLSSASSLPPKDVSNSQSFVDLVKLLRTHHQAAVIAPDKYGRFGLVVSDHSHDDPNDHDMDQSCYAHLYVGKVESVRQRHQALMEASRRHLASSTAAEEPSESPRYEPSTPPWQPSTPPTTSWQPSTPPMPPPPDDNNDAQPDSDAGTLWQPPGSESNGGGGVDSYGGGNVSNWWQPPGTTTTAGSGDYGGEAEGNSYWGDGSGGGGGGTKRPRSDSNDFNDSDGRREGRRLSSQPKPNTFHTDSGAAAADAFYSGLTRTLDTRADSRIYHMRAFNGWVKATQIQELDPQTKLSKKGGGGGGNKPLRILDLACGKGGDLGKWVLHPRGIANYVGIDVARGSLRDAALRARAPNLRSKLRRCTFTCADLGSDVPGRYASTTSSREGKPNKMQKLLSWSLQNESPGFSGDPDFQMVRGGGISVEDRFDVVSIQFAIHYMMSSRKRARRFFQTVSQLLEVGGNLIATTIDARVVVEHLMNLGLDLHFDDNDGNKTNSNGSAHNVDGDDDALIRVGNGACQIRFPMDKVRRIFSSKKAGGNDPENDLFGLEYTFTLVEGSEHGKGVGDAVNLPEWLTPLPMLTLLAEEAGLVLEYAHNFHEFYSERSDPHRNSASHGSLYNMKVLNRNGSISSDEWEISRLYVAVKFRKVRESTLQLDDDENDTEGGDGDANGDDSDDEGTTTTVVEPEPEIDPATKAKLLPMAMMKAKRIMGDEAWRGLSSDEKTKLTDVELRKLASAASALGPGK